MLKADRMLKEAGEGSYLVRESRRYEGAYTLCMNYDDRVLNYKVRFTSHISAIQRTIFHGYISLHTVCFSCTTMECILLARNDSTPYMIW